MTEYRMVRPSHVEVRQVGEEPRIVATVLTYNSPDEYATSFAPGVFAESLAERMPRIVWAHDWADPIGRWVGVVEDSAERLTLEGVLDDPEMVPTAQRALAQLRSGTIDQFSVGFLRQADEDDPDNPGITRITRAQLDEVSLVVSGAVPGTTLISVRSGQVVAEELVVDLARKIKAGTLSREEAIIAIDLASGEAGVVEDEGPSEAELAEIAEVQAEADLALG